MPFTRKHSSESALGSADGSGPGAVRSGLHAARVTASSAVPPTPPPGNLCLIVAPRIEEKIESATRRTRQKYRNEKSSKNHLTLIASVTFCVTTS